MMMVKKSLLIAVLITGIFLPVKSHAQYLDYKEITEPGLFSAMQAMRATQIQYTMFLIYTINSDTPGYVEIGSYNKRYENGDIHNIPFYRFRAGPITETGETLDFYMDANSRGFWMVHLPNNRRGYTRSGRFRIDTSGRLVTMQESMPIVNADNDGFIYIPPNTDITVSRSGVVYADAEPVGKMKVMVFSNDGLKSITTVNGTLFVSDIGQVPEVLPGGDLNYGVIQGHLEESNILKSIVGDVGMLEKSYRATAKAAKILSRSMGSAVQMAQP